MVRRTVHIVLAVAFMFSLGFVDMGEGKAAADCIGHYFAPVGPCVPEPFATYWQQHGGMVRQGNPISDAVQKQNTLDGKSYLTQYFDRAVFEWHPENQPPYNVLLAQIGTFRYKAKYPNRATEGYVWPNNNHRFSETGYTVGGKFYAYWVANGSLAQNGLPISPVFKETSEYDGKDYFVQYLERAELRWQPQMAGTIDEVLSTLQGTEADEAALVNGAVLRVTDISTLNSYHISAKRTFYSSDGPDLLQLDGDIIALDKARMIINKTGSGAISTTTYVIIGDDSYTSVGNVSSVKGGGGKYLMKYYLGRFLPSYNMVSSYNGYQLVGSEAIDSTNCQHFHYTEYLNEDTAVMRLDAWIANSDHTIRQVQSRVAIEYGGEDISFTISNVNNVPDITPHAP